MLIQHIKTRLFSQIGTLSHYEHLISSNYPVAVISFSMFGETEKQKGMLCLGVADLGMILLQLKVEQICPHMSVILCLFTSTVKLRRSAVACT